MQKGLLNSSIINTNNLIDSNPSRFVIESNKLSKYTEYLISIQIVS